MSFLNDRWPLAAVVSTGLVLALAALLLLTGPTHVVLAPWDVFIILDEAWRLHLGQVPGLDFHNPIGPVTYLFSAYGLDLAGPGLYAVVVGTVIFLCLAAVLASCVAYRRLPPLPAAAFILFVALLVTATRQIGRSSQEPGYCEIYNRYGWSLLCIIFLQTCVCLRKGMKDLPLFEGVLAGVTLAVLFYTKLTFALVAFVPVAFACCVRPEWRRGRRLAGLAAGLLATGLLVWLQTRMSVAAYLWDFLEAGKSQTFQRRWPSILVALKGALGYAVPTGIAWIALVASAVAAGRLPLRPAVWVTVFAALAALCAVLAGAGNTGEAGQIPLFVLPGLILLAGTRWAGESMPSRSGSREERRYLVAVAAVVLIAGSIMARDALSIAVSVQWRHYRTTDVPAAQRFDAQPLRDFIIPHNVPFVTNIWYSAQVPGRLNDGFALVRRHVPAGRSVLGLELSNPFPYALGVRAPRGTPEWFDVGLNFNRQHHVAPERLFADVDFVMEPVLRTYDVATNGRPTIEALHDIYDGYLAQQYVEVETSRYWRLLVKRSLSSDSPG